LITADDATWITKKFTWGEKQKTPTAEAKDWNCKYHITTTKKDGFLVVQTE